MKQIFTSLLALCCGAMALAEQPHHKQHLDSQPAAHIAIQTQQIQNTDTTLVAQLAAEVQRLQLRADRWEKARDMLPKISGFAQVGYEASSDRSSFFVKCVRVNLSGNISRTIDYNLHVELNSPRLLDAFVRYRPFDALRIQVGEFKLPFSIENTEYPPTKLEFIEYPMVLYHLVNFGPDISGISASGRDMGAMISGDLFRRGERHILTYELGVFNGEGVNTWDKNHSKDIVGRLMVRPIDGLMLAGYYYWGELGEAYTKRIRYGGGACYDKGMFVARGEYIGATTGNMKSEGWYAMAGVRPAKKVIIAARYDSFIEDRSNKQMYRGNYTVGLTWEPVKYLRCQLNYTYETYKKVGTSNRHVTALMFTGVF